MERIFSERKSVGGDGRATADALVVAWYDASLRVFVMDCDVERAGSVVVWAPPAARHLQTIETVAQAVRTAVTLADAWYTAVAAASPELPRSQPQRQAFPPSSAPAGR